MDWPLENAELSDSDLAKVFRYVPRETTVIRLLTTDPGPVLWSHATPDDWETWLQQVCDVSTCIECPVTESSHMLTTKGVPSIHKDSGLVLILARRAGETAGIFQQILAGTASFGPSRVDSGFKDIFNEKDRSYSWPMGEKIAADPAGRSEIPSDGGKRNFRGGTRQVRQVPFEADTFRDICEKFYVHASISRVISRADVPLFSRAVVKMGGRDSNGSGHPAIVYNCRSANTWKDDLALTVTYFPRSRLTFGILFGCTVAIEKQVLNRIANAKENAFYPLILPGIFAELERTRMVDVVESTIDEIEGAIFELDSGTTAKEISLETSGNGHPGGTRYVRRTVWLNTTFLRSRLQIWRTQLQKMVEHIDELSSTDLGLTYELFNTGSGDGHNQEYKGIDNFQMKRTGIMIKDRLSALIEEYDEKIDECSMRVDGMTIATQWSQGDTNVDIATAAGRDSSQMRSISLVTMVFLPGTFFATVFSMTFFNWFPSNGATIVSGYVWIYFLLTSISTIFTLAVWWYFLGYRQAKAQHSVSKQRLV